MKISDSTAISMPMRNLISIVIAVAIGVWAYFGVIETLNNGQEVLNLSTIHVADIHATDIHATDIHATDIHATDIHASKIYGDEINSTIVSSDNVYAVDYTGTTFNRCVRGWC